MLSLVGNQDFFGGIMLSLVGNQDVGRDNAFIGW